MKQVDAYSAWGLHDGDSIGSIPDEPDDLLLSGADSYVKQPRS